MNIKRANQAIVTNGGDPTSIGFSARLVIAELRRRGIDPQPLLERAGLASVEFADPHIHVSALAEASLIELAARETKEPAFGVDLVQDLPGLGDPRRRGLMFFLAASSQDVRGALEQFSHYAPVVNASIRVLSAFPPAGDAQLEFRYVGVPRHLLRHTTELHVAKLLWIVRKIADRELSPRSVSFAHFRPSVPAALANFFRCSVEFGAERDRIVLTRDSLALPSKFADRPLLETLRSVCDQATTSDDASGHPIRAAVETELHRALARGNASIGAIASALAVSSRTLARSLAEEGTTFSQTLDELRRTLALQYLWEKELTLDRIAELLGYAESGSFYHAFRRWTGRSPSDVCDEMLRER